MNWGPTTNDLFNKPQMSAVHSLTNCFFFESRRWTQSDSLTDKGLTCQKLCNWLGTQNKWSFSSAADESSPIHWLTKVWHPWNSAIERGPKTNDLDRNAKTLHGDLFRERPLQQTDDHRTEQGNLLRRAWLKRVTRVEWLVGRDGGHGRRNRVEVIVIVVLPGLSTHASRNQLFLFRKPLMNEVSFTD